MGFVGVIGCVSQCKEDLMVARYCIKQDDTKTAMRILEDRVNDYSVMLNKKA